MEEMPLFPGTPEAGAIIGGKYSLKQKSPREAVELSLPCPAKDNL